MKTWMIGIIFIISIIIFFKIISWFDKSRNLREYIPNDIKFKIAERDGARCKICGATDNLHLDHIIPVSKWGRLRGNPNNINNLQLLCERHNLQKSDKL